MKNKLIWLFALIAALAILNYFIGDAALEVLQNLLALETGP